MKGGRIKRGWELAKQSWAILRADRAIREDVVGKTHAALDAAGALRSAPAGEPVSEAAASVSAR